LASVVEVVRETRETRVRLRLVVDAEEPLARVETGIGFLDHMVETLAYYAGWRLEASVEEERRVDDHHVSEDLALALGSALRRYLEERGWRVARFGWAAVPMDEALVLAAVDLSGRPGAWVELGLRREAIGGWSTENIPHFVQSLAAASLSTIHLRRLVGVNEHHVVEAGFKALGFALREALRPRGSTVSTKGEIAPEHRLG
jgi:imidazoleglycerol phosphate dehydratase HisB